MKIFIVDDSKELLFLLESMLKGSGYEVTSASNGKEALEGLRRNSSVDLIVSDILMPVMDGFQFCRECKKDEALKNIPFLFYTGSYLDKGDEEFGLGLGAVRFIMKPMEREYFLEIIKDVLEEHKRGLLPPPEKSAEKEDPVFLKEYNERLVKKLEDKLVELESANNTLRESEEELRKRSHDLEERVKELHCLYAISNLVEKPDISYEALIQGIVNLMPPAWQYPEITCARIILENQEFKTDNLKETIWKQAGDIILDGKEIGVVEIFYLEERPESDEGPFLKEERSLIKAIAKQIEKIIEHKQDEGELKRYHEQLSKYSKNLNSAVLKLKNEVEEGKATEGKLRQSKKEAEAANRAKSEFLASMSHEIRTPMNAIVGMADLLWESALTPEQKEYVQSFQSVGENLLNIINDILDISKVEAGYLELEAIEFNLGEIVKKTCEVLTPRAHEKGLELVSHVKPDVPTDLVGDPVRLRQILINLIGNAIKFTNKGDVRVEVKIADWELRNAELKKGLNSRSADRNRKSEIELLFSVMDTGIGIPPETVSGIFDIFTQADPSTTRKHGGTGLGLNISKQLVEIMGGRIWVESKFGHGSNFYFNVMFEVQTESKSHMQTAVLDLKGIKTLVVDDDVKNRMTLRKILYEWGALVREAEDGKHGLSELKRAREATDPYGLVLLDSRMPGMAGMEVAEYIKKEPSLADMIVMMLTRDHRSDDVARCKKLDAADYLIKPINRSKLFEAITAVMAKAKMAAEGPEVTKPAVFEELRTLHILLVEDFVHNRLLIQAYLKKTPYHLDIAENGEIAVEKFKSGKYDLVLMDIRMPVMDGYAATRAIREWEATDFGMKNSKKQNREQSAIKRVPIIALTAYGTKEEKQKSLDAGCIAHLTKPIKKAKLMETIRKYTITKGKVAMGQNSNDQQGEKIIVHVDPDLEDLIPGFLENRHKDAEALQEALSTDDYETIQKFGHTMKGSGGGYGFDAITDIGNSLEYAAKEKDGEECRKWVGELLDYLERVEVVYE